jgi:cell division septation protein DedD
MVSEPKPTREEAGVEPPPRQMSVSLAPPVFKEQTFKRPEAAARGFVQPSAELFSQPAPSVREKASWPVREEGLPKTERPGIPWASYGKAAGEAFESLGAKVLQAAKKVPQQYWIMGFAGLVFLVIAVQFFGSKKVPRELIQPAASQRTVSSASVAKPAEIKKTIQRVEAPPLTAVPPSPEAQTPAKSGGLYTVQLCLSDDRAASENLLARLGAKGYEAFMRQIRSGGNLYYQIYVGRCRSSSEAQAVWKKLQQDAEFKIYHDSFVRSV